LGSFLQLGRDLGAILLYPESAREACIHLPFEALQTDVRGHRNLNRQRTTEEVKEVGTMDRQAMQKTISGEANARAEGTYVVASIGPRQHALS
jgi:hypothetical protein